MDVTTMARITSLISKLKNNAQLQAALPNLTLKEGEIFGWDHTAHAVTYDPSHPQLEPLLLHEVGHAMLGHTNYKRDIELIEMERAAWEEAEKLGEQYSVVIDESLVEETLDTYRDWLHERSTCPHCRATGVQTGARQYTCLACQHIWRVNEARTCALRRYQTTKKRS